MPLDGRPDFDSRRPGEEYVFFRGFEGGPWTAVPDQLELQREEDGRPDFALKLVRPADPAGPPKPHALLRFRMEPAFSENGALREVRKIDRQATVARPVFEEGYVRFLPNTSEHSVPESVRSPTRINGGAAGSLHLSTRIDREAGALLRGFIEDGVAPVRARAELVLSGAAARAPVQVEFDPAALAKALFDGGGTQAREDLLRTLQEHLATLPLTVSRQRPAEERSVADALLDRLTAAFLNWTPAPDDDPRPHLDVPNPDSMSAGRFRWDLSAPRRARRLFLLQADPFGMVARADGEWAEDRPGAHSAFVKKVTVPGLDAGHESVQVGANLPVPRPGVPLAGANVRVPARPPARIQEQAKTAEFAPPSDEETLRFRFSPDEAPRYLVTPFLVVETEDGARRLEGEESEKRGKRVLVTVSDFPVQFIPVDASEALLKRARVEVILTWSPEEAGRDSRDDSDSQGAHEESRTVKRMLASDSPRTLFTPPAGAEGQIRFRAYPKEQSEPVVTSAPHPMRPARATRASFSEYGPQRVRVQVRFGEEASLCVLELRPADPQGKADPTVMHFTPDDPEKSWHWFSTSLFAHGYQYRRQGQAEGAWSDPVDAGTPLTVHAVEDDTP